MKPVLATLLLCASSLAFAHNCPNEMKAIDAKLQTGPDLSEQQLKKVRELRTQGESLHKEGKHDASMAALGEAKQILGIQ